jgi:flagellar basal-body rod modification protein FlgD
MSGTIGFYGTNSTAGIYDSENTVKKTATDNATVDKTQFLNLLVTQLKNQDPMNPLKSDEFIAQLATFSSLEQLISINQAVTKLSNGSADATKTSPK